MMSKIDLEGVTRIATRYLESNPPKDRAAALDELVSRYGPYDMDRDTLAASVDAYYEGEASRR